MIGLIDVDGHSGFPNIPLMKISAWHKAHREEVTWFSPLWNMWWERVYMAKVFSFTPNYAYPINASEIIRGGSGYMIHNVDGKEKWLGTERGLPEEVEHIYPDYDLYGIRDRAYGFLSRGCYRGCPFCHVASKEGRRSRKVADLAEFWNGQKEIEICDPNILACPDAEDLLRQLAESKAKVEFNQGLDARLISDANVELLARIRLKSVHFTWDRMRDGDAVIAGIRRFIEKVKYYPRDISVYCLVNYETSMAEDLERIYKLRELGVSPYVMVYDKEHAGKDYKRLQRWVNHRAIFWSTEKFEDYAR